MTSPRRTEPPTTATRSQIPKALQRTLSASGITVWEWDPASDVLDWPGSHDPRPRTSGALFASFQSPGCSGLQTQWAESLESKQPLEFHGRRVDADGQWRIRAAWEDDVLLGTLQPETVSESDSANEAGANEVRLRALIDHAPLCIHEIDLNGHITSMNRAGLQMMGLEKESQICGVQYVDCTSDQDRERINALMERAFAGESSDFEFTTDTEPPQTFASCFVPIRDENGAVFRLMGLTSDVTAERAARERLRSSSERYRMAQRIAHVGVWEWDLASDELFLTDEAVRMLALPSDKKSFSIETLTDRVDAAFRRQWSESVRACLEDGREQNLEFRILTADGAYRWIASLADARRDADGTATHLTGVMMEITQRKRSELALRESEERFQLAVRGSTDGIWDWNIESGQVFYSARYKELMGFDAHDPFASDLNGFTDTLHPEDLEPTWAAINLHLEERAPYDHEFRMRTKRGDYRWFRSRGQAVWMSDGTPTRMAGSIQDVTDKREAQRLLREVVDHVPHEIFAKDSSGRFVLSNRKHAADLNMTPDEVVGMTQADLTPNPAEAAAFLADDRRVIKSGTPLMVPEETFTNPDGELIVLQTHKIPLMLPTAAAPTMGVLGVAIDITDLKRTEQQLRTREEQFRSLVETTSDWVWEMNANCEHTYTNGRLRRILGYALNDEFEKLNIFELFAEDERDEIRNRVRRAIDQQAGWRNQVVRILAKDGQYRYLESSAAPVLNDAGEVIGFRGIDRDITDRKLAEVERENLITELGDKNAELERFTYTVSHDLKSPLITIKGFLGLLKRDMDRQDYASIDKRIERIRAASDQMSLLLDELLELSRIGRVNNTRQPSSLTEIAEEAVELVGGVIEEHQVDVEVQSNMPVVLVDRPRLLEVYQNLIDNACRFLGDAKERWVRAGMRVDDGESVFFVADNGIGIAPEYQEKVLGLFEQLNPELGGTGIGLAIVKRIIEVHQGRIWIESDGPNSGTTVCFTIGAVKS